MTRWVGDIFELLDVTWWVGDNFELLDVSWGVDDIFELLELYELVNVGMQTLGLII